MDLGTNLQNVEGAKFQALRGMASNSFCDAGLRPGTQDGKGQRLQSAERRFDSVAEKAENGQTLSVIASQEP